VPTFFPGDWRCPTCGHGWTCHETHTHVEYVRKDPLPKKKKPKLEIPYFDHSAEKLLKKLRNFMRDSGPDSLTLMPPAKMAAAGKKKTRPKSANPVRRDATVADKLKKQQVEFVQKQRDFLKKQAQEAAVRKEARKQKQKKQDAATPRKVDFIRCEPCASGDRKVPEKWLKQMDDAPVGNRISISIPGVRIVNHSVSPSPRKNDLKSPSNIREMEIAADELLYSARSFVSQDSFVEEDVHLKESDHKSSAVPSTTSSSFAGTSQGISENPSQTKQSSRSLRPCVRMFCFSPVRLR